MLTIISATKSVKTFESQCWDEFAWPAVPFPRISAGDMAWLYWKKEKVSYSTKTDNDNNLLDQW